MTGLNIPVEQILYTEREFHSCFESPTNYRRLTARRAGKGSHRGMSRDTKDQMLEAYALEDRGGWAVTVRVSC